VIFPHRVLSSLLYVRSSEEIIEENPVLAVNVCTQCDINVFKSSVVSAGDRIDYLGRVEL